MRILISGATGLVGRAFARAAAQRGDEVIALVRASGAAPPSAVRWDPARGMLEPRDLSGLDAVVHLAGEPIAAGRWNVARKKAIRESRVAGTRLLCERLAEADSPPPVIISASAVGFYGNRGDEELDETSRPGSGFLAEVCSAWEAETSPAIRVGIRVVNLRIGMVLSREGGALAKMLPPFRLGLGGPLGNGAMWVSWIHLSDLVAAIQHAIEKEVLAGPVNATAPDPVRNREFTRTLARVLGRPAVFPVPAPALRLALGEMADELLLSSARVAPGRLTASGFNFQFPSLEAALRDVLLGDGGA